MQFMASDTIEQLSTAQHSTKNGMLFSYKKEWNNVIYINMNGPRDYHTKLGKSEK